MCDIKMNINAYMNILVIATDLEKKKLTFLSFFLY